MTDGLAQNRAKTSGSIDEHRWDLRGFEANWQEPVRGERGSGVDVDGRALRIVKIPRIAKFN